MISIDYFRKMESSIVEMAFYEITFSVVSYSHLLYCSSVSESIEFLRRDHWEKEIERRRPYETGYVKLKEWLHKQHRHIHIHLDFQDFIENNIVVIWSCNCKLKSIKNEYFSNLKSQIKGSEINSTYICTALSGT